MQQRAEHDDGRRGGPQEIERQQVERAGEPAHHAAAHPLAGQQRRRRRAEDRDEVDERPESFRPRELLRTHESEQHDDAGRREHGDDAQDVARAPRRKRVHEDERERRCRSPPG